MEHHFNDTLEQLLKTTSQSTSIGRLGEKTLHRVLKYCFEPNDQLHEVKLGRYHADIASKNEIIEIQSRSFNVLRAKLTYFLPIMPVRIVYPLVNTKHLVWVDTETGEVTKRRKSPKTGNLLEFFYELYKIKSFLDDQNLRFSIVSLDVVEYRNLDGYSADKKRGSSRNERIPEKFINVVEINSKEDYKLFLPHDLPDNFTTKDIASTQKISLRTAGLALNVLNHIGIVERVGKKGNSFLYAISK